MKKLFVIVLAAIGMVSCMNTDEVIEVNNDNAIAFADAFIENSVRAEINNDNLTQFNVWGWMQEDAVEAPVFNAMEVTLSGADWTYSPAQYWVPGFTYTFKALSSNGGNGWVAAETTDGKLGEVTFTNVDGTEDLIYAAPAAVAAPALGTTAQPVELEFNHQLAKVKFDFEYAPELVAALELSGLTVKAEEITMKVPGKATIDYSATTPAWILDTTAAQTTLAFAEEGVEKLTIPAGAAYEYVITFKVKYYQGANVIKTIDKTSKISLAIEMGKAYNFTATLTPDNLGLTTIDFETSVEGWDDAGAGFEPEKKINYVSNNEELQAAIEGGADKIILLEDIALTADISTRAAEATPTITIANGKSLTIDLNGKKLSAISTNNSDNYDMILVKGNLTVKNGTIETKHEGQNMGWGAMTTIFDITAGGIVNLEGVTAKNLGGSDMNFVAHLNNWGEVTLNVENSTLESTYVPVRVFNSGNDMNNVTIKNSTLNGVSAAFWVHNYTVEDFGTQAKADAHKALLNFEIYNNGNTFSPDVNGIRYGFTNSVRSDAYGITKTVSEDGTEVILGSIVEDGLIRRNVAGAEENTTIKKAVVGEGVTTLYDRTFRRFYALETVELPSTLTTIGAAGSGVFQSCTALKNIVIPESVTVLGKGTFQECAALESINIPAGVTRIEENCLRATGLVSVEFHEGVTYFGAQAFRDCKQLKEVIIKAPSFTVEANAFGIMSGAHPGTKIYVANAEMKAYLESTLTYKNQFTIISTEVEDVDSFWAAVEAGNPIIDATGVVIEGTTMFNHPGVTVIGATFKNENGIALRETISGTFKSCVFEGSEAIRWAYTKAGETVVFENCVIKTDFRGFHFDGMEGDVLFKNCEINGFNAYGGEGTATFEGCTFGCDESSYNGLNIYSNTVLKDCTFNFISGKTNFIDMEGTGKTLSISNCNATLDGAAANIQDYIGGSKKAQNTIIVDGLQDINMKGVGLNAQGAYVVTSGEGFLNVATKVLNDGNKNVTVELANDIDLAGIEWPAVCTKAAFVLDGKGYAIKNLTTSAVEDHGFYSTAMFTSTRKATTIKNLVVENATVTGKGGDNSHGAVLVACNYAALTIEGVTVKNSTISNCDRTGGLVTYLYFTSATVNNCKVEGCTINSIGTAGAILGVNNSNDFTMKGCQVVNTTVSSSEGSNKAGILIGTWQDAGTLTSVGNTHSGSKAINAGVETNNEIGRHA